MEKKDTKKLAFSGYPVRDNLLTSPFPVQFGEQAGTKIELKRKIMTPTFRFEQTKLTAPLPGLGYSSVKS